MEAAATKLKQQRVNCLFIMDSLGHSDGVVESFLDSWISPLPGLFHTLGDDGGSGGGFGADAIEGGAGDATDRIGKNSGGIKLAHTS